MRGASSMTEHLLALADAFCASEFRSKNALSGMILGKGGFFSKLERGQDCTTATAERVLVWFDENWPIGLAWIDANDVIRRNGVGRPTAREAHLPVPSREFLASLAHAPIWINGRRPSWWADIPVREFLTQSHRQMSILRAAKKGQALFGDRCPKKSAIHMFWHRLDVLSAQSPDKQKEVA